MLYRKHTLSYFQKKLSILLLIAIPFSVFSQSNFPVKVVDNSTGEPLIGVLTYTDDHSFTATTDVNGKINLNNLGHRDNVNFSYLGYTTISLPFYEIRKLSGVVKMFTSLQLDSIVVVGRRDDPIEKIPYVVERLSGKDIRFTGAQTAADALLQHSNVYVQKSQMGGGSPVIRGFEANKVLLVVDGVRMNNAIYRAGHVQNSITLDNGTLDQVEVIYGPGSLTYGSDALGGVVHYRTRDPQVLFTSASDYKFQTGVFTRFSSANQEKTAHVDLDYRSQNWGAFTSLTYSDFGDLRAGANRSSDFPDLGKRRFYILRNENVDEVKQNGDPNIQVGTGYSQIDLLQKVRYQPSEDLYFILNMQYSTSSNIPRYDNLTDTLGAADDLKWAEWYYGPQKRLMTSLKTRVLKSRFHYDKATFIAAFQNIHEDRLKRRYRRRHMTFNLEKVNVYSFTADYDKGFGKEKRHTLSYGWDVQHNVVNSKAGRRNRTTGSVILDEISRYPSAGSTMTTFGAYLDFKWNSADSVLSLQAGGRYTRSRLKASYQRNDPIEWPEYFYTEGIGNNSQAFTWGTGLTVNTKDKWQLRLLASTAFRAPNLDDFAKIRAQDGSVTAPNPDLEPEHSINGEVTLGKTFGQVTKNSGLSLQLSGTGFYTRLTDVIVNRKGTLPGGETSLIIDEELHRVTQNFNESEGYVYGFSGNLVLNLRNTWKLNGSINYQRGRTRFDNSAREVAGGTIDTLVPLDHIPPTYGRVGLSYHKNKLRADAILFFNFEKSIEEYAIRDIIVDELTGEVLQIDREGTFDNLEETDTCHPTNVNGQYVLECFGSPAWATLNFYVSYQFNSKFNVKFGYENVMDRHYRTFGSGVSAAGRNFTITLAGKF